MKVHWKEDVLNLPQCQAQVGRNQELIFVGPRVKMGIYEGIPTRVAPHTTTGSADYFGPLVNRSALTPELLTQDDAVLRLLCSCWTASG